jgi:hypothetical protein
MLPASFNAKTDLVKVEKKKKKKKKHPSPGPKRLNPFTAEVAIMRLLGSAPKSHLCDQKRRSKVTGLSGVFIPQRAFNVFKNRLN